MTNSKSTICLNMIVKDEEHVIVNTLNNILKYINLEYWVISDTGSSDNTKEIIIDFFKNKNIDGELVEHEWQDFGYNRTQAIQAAYNKSDYVLIFDADDSIHGDLILPFDLSPFDKYDLKFGKDFTYVRPLLVNNRKKWEWVGVLHEYLSCIDKPCTESRINGDYYIESGKTGGRSKDPEKYLKDAITLENAYYKIEHTNKGLAGRYAFYCGQSYKDANVYDKSIEWYSRVLTLNNWSQEKYYACFMLGDLHKFMGKQDEAISYYLKSQEYDKQRMEGIVSAMEMYFKKGKHQDVWNLYNQFKNYTINPPNKLFLYEDKYKHKLEYFNSISAFYANKKQDAYECCKKIIGSCILDGGLLTQTLSNMQYYIDNIKEDEDTYTLFKAYNHILSVNLKEKNIDKHEVNIWNILFEKNKDKLTKYKKYEFINIINPSIIITFTTCKRLDLFQQTINSILNTWEDVDKIDYWFCVDDNSSKEDKDKMIELYPFIDFYFKKETEKGHRESMNIIFNKLKDLNPKYWIHMEDDFLFYKKMNYIETALNGLLLMEHLNVKQILFNRNYAETIGDYNIKNHVPFFNKQFVIHDYKPNHNPPFPNCYYWPNYSFRPSLIDVSTILQLGNFDSTNQFFEMDYAHKWTRTGYKSGFFNELTNRHIGRLTSERNTSKKNAYELNDESQFVKKSAITSKNEIKKDIVTNNTNIKLINLDRRRDRLDYVKSNFTLNFDRYSAVDGNKLNQYTENYDMLHVIDGKKCIFGEIGCKLSHYNLWKTIKKPTLIIEDDIMVTENTTRLIEEIFDKIKDLHFNWTLLFVGGQWTPNYGINSKCHMKVHQINEKNKNNLFIDLQNNFYVRLNPGVDVFNSPLYRTTAAYIINPDGAQELIKLAETNKDKFMKEPLDIWLLNMEKEKKVSYMDYFDHPIYQGGFDLMKEKCLLQTDIHRSNSNVFNLNTSVNNQEIEKIKREFVFIPGKDEIGNDSYYKKMSLENMLYECYHNKTVGVNTLGFFKKNVNNLQKSKYFGKSDGIYIKKSHYLDMINCAKIKRIKLLGNFWDSEKELVDEFNLMIPNRNYIYDNYEITCENEDIDYYIILNKPKKDTDYYDPKKTLVFTMEPYVEGDPNGVSSWGKWAKPDPSTFMYVHTRDKLNLVQWRLKDHPDMYSLNLNKSLNSVASIMSWKNYFIGHKKRIEIIKQMENKNILDVYGKENYHKFKNYKGKLENDDPYSVMKKYKYYFMIENNSEKNYATEKIWEPIISECLCFYWGCPNLNDYIDEKAYVLLDVNNIEESVKIIETAIKEDWWSQRIEIIRKEKNKILYEMGFFPMIKNLLKSSNVTYQFYNVWHHKLFDKCYEKCSKYDLSKITMYGVNESYKKFYNDKKDYNILYEYDLPYYDKSIQEKNYCQTSALMHIYKNNIHKQHDYVGFIQYDMEIFENCMSNIESYIQNNSDIEYVFYLNPNKRNAYELFLQNHNKEKVLDPKGLIWPYENSILQKYNDFFNTNYRPNDIVHHDYDYVIPLLHTFLIPQKMFDKMMKWFYHYFDWVDENMYKITEMDHACFTERMLSLFFAIEMIHNKNIKCVELKLKHVWPLYHSQTTFKNYKNWDTNLIKDIYDELCKQDFNQKIICNYANECENINYLCNTPCKNVNSLVQGLIINTSKNKKVINILQETDKSENIKDVLKFSTNVDVVECKHKINTEINLAIEVTDMLVINCDSLSYEKIENIIKTNMKNINKYIVLFGNFKNYYDKEGLFNLIMKMKTYNKDFKICEKIIKEKGILILNKRGEKIINNFHGIENLYNYADISIIKPNMELHNIKEYTNNSSIKVTIFILSELIDSYIEFLLGIKCNFDLITSSNIPYCMPYLHYPVNNMLYESKVNMILGKKNLENWYSKNICVTSKNKLKPLPLGPKWNWTSREIYGEDREKMMIKYNNTCNNTEEKFNKERSKLVYFNFETHTTDDTFYKDHENIRNKLNNILLKNNFIKSNRINFEDYLDELEKYKFCFCPPGKGIDTHRAWESLLVGTIPIMVSTSLDGLFENLPVIIEDDWEKIDEDYLINKYDELKKRHYDFSSLYFNNFKPKFIKNNVTFQIKEK